MKSIFTYLSAVALVVMTATSVQAERMRLQPVGSESQSPTQTQVRPAVTSESNIIPQPLKVVSREAGVVRAEEIINEDFNNVPDGEFEQIGNIGLRATTFLASHYFDPGRYIDTSYTPESGTWEGDWVYAGKDGTIILQCYNQQAGAYFRTPLGDYSGDLTVRMRVRAAKTFLGADNELGYVTTNGSDFNLRAGIGGYDSYDLPITNMGAWGQLQSGRIYGEDWVEFEFTFRNESANHDGFLEINTSTAIEIDWIKVTDAATFLACPVVNAPTHFTADGFTINWDPVRRSQNYYIDLWQVNYTADSGVSEFIDFEDGTLPSDWVADEASIENGNGVDGGFGLQIGYNGAGAALESPDYGKKLNALELNVMFEINDEGAYNNEKGYGFLLIDGLTEDGWQPIGQICCDGFRTRGGIYYRYKVEGADFENLYTAIRMYTDGVADANHVWIDNVNLYAERPYELVRVVEDGHYQYIPNEGDDPDAPYNYWVYTRPADPCSYTFSGLDSETEYWYRVRSHYVSDFSIGEKYHAFGVASPTLESATAIGGGAYTAHWKDAPKAQSYIVRNYLAREINESEEDYMLIDESFSKCRGSSGLEGLTEIGNIFETSLDDYTDICGWTGVGNAYGDGLIGGFTYGSKLVTPMLPVNPARGGYTIYIEALGMYGEAMVVNFLDRRTSGYLYFDEYGVISGILPMTDAVAGERIQFSTMNGTPFAFSAFGVSQNVEKGDIVSTYLSETIVPAGTQAAVFTGLDNDVMYAFQVISRFDLEKQTAYSDSLDKMVVDMKNSGSLIVGKIDEQTELTEVERVNAAGLRVGDDYCGVVIVRMSDGSVRKMLTK